MIVLDLQRLDVDLSPAVPDYTGGQISEKDDWDPIPEHLVFDLVCYPSIWDTAGTIKVPAVVSKAGRTPFRMSAEGTWDQGCVEAIVFPNLADYTEEEWEELFGDQYKLVNRPYHGTDIKIEFTHPQWGMTTGFVSLDDNQGSLRCKVSIPYPPCRCTPAIGYVPLDAVNARNGLTAYALEGLNRYGWEPDPAEVERVKSEVTRWNTTEWIPIEDVLTSIDVSTLNDSDSRKTSASIVTRVRYKDPTGFFQGLQEVAGKRSFSDEVENLYPRSLWMDRWLDSLLPQWE